MGSYVRIKSSRSRPAPVIHYLGLQERSVLEQQHKLPTAREVLCVYLYEHRRLGKTKYDSGCAVYSQIEEIYGRARLPIQDKTNIVKKLDTLYERYRVLNKLRGRKLKPAQMKTQEKREENFLSDIAKLFIVVKKDLLINGNPVLQEDLEFYKKQLLPGKCARFSAECSFRCFKDFRWFWFVSSLSFLHDFFFFLGRIGYMAGVDSKLLAKEARFLRRQRAAALYKQKVSTPESVCMPSTSTATPVPSEEMACDDPDDPASVSDADEDFIVRTKPKKKRPKRLTDGELGSTFDWAKLSHGKVVHVVSAVLAKTGNDISEYACSRSSIRRHRIEERKSLVANLKNEMAETECRLSLHWDGKIMEDIASKVKVDRLPVLVVDIDEAAKEHLLGAPKLERGNAEQEFQAITNLLSEWALKARVVAFGFDTTSTNSGRHSGVCARLEGDLGINALHLACRHHIFEIVLKAVYTASLGEDNTPTISLCKTFKDRWDTFDLTECQLGTDDREVMRVLRADLDELIVFYQSQLQASHIFSNLAVFQPRSDYKNLLVTALLFLGVKLPEGAKLCQPGGTNDTRWMARAHYTLLMYLLRSQFPLQSAQYQKNLRTLCIFLVRHYLPQWYMAPSASKAAVNDLQFLKGLTANKSVWLKPLCEVSLKKFTGHLWYLSEDLVGLSIFDSRLSAEEKKRIVQAMRDNPGNPDPPKRISINLKAVAKMELSEFVSQNSRVALDSLGMPLSFLDKEPEEWDELPDYQKCCKIVGKLHVVNDIAERGVKLTQEVNKILTNDEEQKQCLLQSVKKHRDTFPNVNKSTLKNMKREHIWAYFHLRNTGAGEYPSQTTLNGPWPTPEMRSHNEVPCVTAMTAS
ncbi:hypothetical protein FOCC_FOCC004390 [Frankliniella occidentalis]|nr:hypothetical protein FOCC_FOCC004390 [Frankliniella occidentalis]